MDAHATDLTEIKDRGIILQRKLVRDDDVILHILSQHHGRVVVYAFKAAISKRRFANACEVMRHVQFYAKRGKQGGLGLRELETLNYYSHLTQNYRLFQIASNAVTLIRKLAPLESPNLSLYRLLGSFLQILSQEGVPAFVHYVFELKALQYSGLLTLGESCLQCDKKFGKESIQISFEGVKCSQCMPHVSEKNTIFPGEQTRIRQMFGSHHLKTVFGSLAVSIEACQKLKPLIERIKVDYGLK